VPFGSHRHLRSADGVSAPETTTEAGGLPFQVRGSMQTMLCLRLLRPEDPSFFDQLVDKIAHNPDFFRDAPLVLDVGPATDAAAGDLASMVERLRRHRLVPVGVQNASAAWKEAAAAAGLAVFAQGGNSTAGSQNSTTSRAPASSPSRQPPAKPVRAPTVIVRQPVRGGQQVSSEGDMVVLAAVSPGAEIAAAGCIHVYGALRGRAFAGMEGDETAMIFCDQMSAELVSIAGLHLVNEEIDERLLNKRVRIVCDGERLLLQPLP